MRHKTLFIRGVVLIATLLLLSVLGANVFAISAPLVYWRPANNGLPPDVQALAAAPSSPGTPGLPPVLYVGTWGSGIYRSTDHGATWISATAGLTLPHPANVRQGGLAVNPLTPTTLFAGDYFGALSGVGVYRSTDGGISWTVSLHDVGVETLLVHPLTSTLVFAGTVENGLYRSQDNGETWETSLSARRVQALAAASVAPGPIYARVAPTPDHPSTPGWWRNGCAERG